MFFLLLTVLFSRQVISRIIPFCSHCFICISAHRFAARFFSYPDGNSWRVLSRILRHFMSPLVSPLVWGHMRAYTKEPVQWHRCETRQTKKTLPLTNDPYTSHHLQIRYVSCLISSSSNVDHHVFLMQWPFLVRLPNRGRYLSNEIMRQGSHKVCLPSPHTAHILYFLKMSLRLPAAVWSVPFGVFETNWPISCNPF